MAKWKKVSEDENKTSNRSLKKRLAVATVAASLGMSLGVPVADVLAEDAGISTPPGYSIKDRVNEQMDELDAATSDQEEAESTPMTKESTIIKWDKNSSQIKLDTVNSTQFKWDNQSTQIKLDNVESNQLKWDKGSTQFKVENTPVEP